MPARERTGARSHLAASHFSCAMPGQPLVQSTTGRHTLTVKLGNRVLREDVLRHRVIQHLVPVHRLAG